MVNIDTLSEYTNCEKCNAPFSDLYIGGVGDWRTTIMCQRCFHIRDGLSWERVIIPLVARQYNLTIDEARKRDAASQAEYEKMVAEASDFG